MDFGKGTTRDIRKAIYNKVEEETQALREDKTINIFSKGSTEYQRLEAAANILTLYSNDVYYVGETYFDYGQNWKWTTILKKDSSFGAVQALTPKEQKDILEADSPTDLGKACDAVLNRKPYI